MNEHENVLALIQARDQAPFAADIADSALIVVDMQRNFTQPDAPFAQALERVVPGVTAAYIRRAREQVIPNVARLLRFFREHRRPVMFTATGTCTGCGADLAGWLQGFDALGRMALGHAVWPKAASEFWAIDPALAPAAHEIVVNKTSSGGLNATALDQTLRNLGARSVVVCGVSSDICVSTTAREVADRGFQLVVAEDACTTLSDQMHRASMDALALAFGRVRTTDQVIELLSRSVRAAPAAAIA